MSEYTEALNKVESINRTETATTETKVRIFWAMANDSTEVTRTIALDPKKYETDFSFTTLDDAINFCLWSHESVLEEVYSQQGNNLEGEKLFDCQCTLSVGDVIEITDEQTSDDVAPDCTVYMVAPVGFIKIQVNEDDELFKQWRNKTTVDRIWMARKLYKSQL